MGDPGPGINLFSFCYGKKTVRPGNADIILVVSIGKSE